MLSQLVNWGHVVEHAGDDRGSLLNGLLDTYRLVASDWGDGDAGVDVHLYDGLWGVIVLPWPYDDTTDDDAPDPWSDAYRKRIDAQVDQGQFYASYGDAAEAIRELEDPDGTPARLLPTLDRFSERPPPLPPMW